MDFVKVTGTEENCKLLQKFPMEIETLKEKGKCDKYTIYYKTTPEDTMNSFASELEYICNDNCESVTLEIIHNQISENDYFILPLSKISELLQLSITGATVYEPFDSEPPSLVYYKYENGVMEYIDTTDDKFLKKRAETKFEEYDTVDEDGEYFIP